LKEEKERNISRGGNPSFFIASKKEFSMEKAKLKELYTKLKQILAELESEIYSDKDSYVIKSDKVTIVEDDDGYID
jgi:phage FluMu gp28-like protein